jgi:hypothetical protein
VFVETALPPEEQRYTNLLRAAGSAGLQLAVTPGAINEIQTHLELGLACERAGDRWEGDYPFVYRQWLERWPNRQSYAALLGQFMGRDDPERDLLDFLGIHVGIRLIDLAEHSRAFGLQVTGIVSQAWRERKQRRAVALADPMALDIRVNHDVEMYLGVMSMRKRESPSVYGHEAWLVTTDSTAFRMPELIAGGGVPFTSSPAMHPNFSVADQMEPETGALALCADARRRKPDLGHEVAAGKFGQHVSIDLVGLGGERGQALRFHRICNSDVPAPPLKGVVDEPRASHGLYGRGHLLAVAQDAIGEGAQGVRVWVNGRHLDRPTILVEQVHIEPLARQVQSGVQHVWASSVLVALTTQRCHRRGPFS